MENIITKGTYEMDLDKNDFIALTKKNVDFINGILSLDSSYRKAFGAKEGSAAYYIKNKFYQNERFSQDPEIIEEVIRRIDKENSTHLIVSGNKKGNNEVNKKGIEKTKNKVCELFRASDIVEKLKSADADLVGEIATAVENRNNFSFASKFCAFVTQAAFIKDEEKDGYCLYDKVLSEVLPYYAWVYLGNDEYVNKNNKSIVEKTFKEKHDYKGYRELIDAIIEASEKITGERIKRADFDHLVWYYFKGDKELVQKCLECVGVEKAKMI